MVTTKVILLNRKCLSPCSFRSWLSKTPSPLLRWNRNPSTRCQRPSLLGPFCCCVLICTLHKAWLLFFTKGYFYYHAEFHPYIIFPTFIFSFVLFNSSRQTRPAWGLLDMFTFLQWNKLDNKNELNKRKGWKLARRNNASLQENKEMTEHDVMPPQTIVTGRHWIHLHVIAKVPPASGIQTWINILSKVCCCSGVHSMNALNSLWWPDINWCVTNTGSQRPSAAQPYSYLKQRKSVWYIMLLSYPKCNLQFTWSQRQDIKQKCIINC